MVQLRAPFQERFFNIRPRASLAWMSGEIERARLMRERWRSVVRSEDEGLFRTFVFVWADWRTALRYQREILYVQQRTTFQPVMSSGDASDIRHRFRLRTRILRRMESSPVCFPFLWNLICKTVRVPECVCSRIHPARISSRTPSAQNDRTRSDQNCSTLRHVRSKRVPLAFLQNFPKSCRFKIA